MQTWFASDKSCDCGSYERQPVCREHNDGFNTSAALQSSRKSILAFLCLAMIHSYLGTVMALTVMFKNFALASAISQLSFIFVFVILYH